MEYRQLVDVSNAAMVSLIESMFNMGLDVSLIWTQMAQALKEDGLDMLEQAGVKITGNDVQSVTNSFAEEFKKVGIVHIANVEEVTEDRVVIELGECVFMPATAKVREKLNDVNALVPCPVLAALAGQIEQITGKHAYQEAATYLPERSSTRFVMILE